MPVEPETNTSAAAKTMRGAAQLHREGKTAEAEAAYLALLSNPSARFDALHMLGVLRSQQGRPAEAIECLHAALAMSPRAVAVMSNLGLVLASLGRDAEALEIYEAALAR
jgi:protein O-GlcNAc transferase